jgi:hypothetical protein
MHLAGGCSASSFAGQAPLAGLHELLQPGEIQALGDALLAAQLGNAVITAQPIERDADLVLGREMATGLPLDVLQHRFHRGLHRRLSQGVMGPHLSPFVTPTKPQHSLNHGLKTLPLLLTEDFPI